MLRGWSLLHRPLPPIIRLFTTTANALKEKPLPPRRQLLESEITESFLKGSGPGGQKINKTSSAVQLKHLPTGLVVKCQETRSRDQNRRYARQILAEKLDELEKGAESRTAIKTERVRVKKASSAKKSRRKYRKLDEERRREGSEGGVGGGGDEAVGGRGGLGEGVGADSTRDGTK